MLCTSFSTCGTLILQLLAFGLSNGAIIALNALGVTLVYSVVRTVNFAYGDLFALSTVLATQCVLVLGLQAGGPFFATLGGLGIALLAAMAFGAFANVAVERLAFRPFRGRSSLAPLIAGIGISFMLFQAAITWRIAAEVGFGNPEHHSDVDNLANVPHFSIPTLIPNTNLAAMLGLPLRYTLKDLLLIGLALSLCLGVTWFLQASKAGRALRACAQDPEMAQLCGINRNQAISGVFALGGALAGAAAFIFTLYYERPFGQHGAESGLLAFTAAVLGGIGNPLGALAGGILLGVFGAFSDYFLPAQWTPVLTLAILIAMLTLRPSGLAAEDQTTEPEATERQNSPSATSVGRIRQMFNRSIGLLIKRAIGYRLSAIGLLIKRAIGYRLSAIGYAIGAILLLAYPLLDGWLHIQRQAIVNNMLIFALLALGLNIVLGMAGMLDLGFAACFAVGGYTAAVLIGSPIGAKLDFTLVLLIATISAGLFGALNGLLTLRLRGDYLAVVALAFGQLVPRVIVNLSEWTGGRGGMAALPPPMLAGITFQNQGQRYYLVLGFVALTVVASRRIATSRIGRAWAALSTDELAAASCGISRAQIKPLAFILGAMVAGIAAALSATIFGYVDPDQSDFRISAMTLAMVVIGGASSPIGAVVGAIVIAGYDQIALPALGQWWAQSIGKGAAIQLSELNYLAFGLALYLTVLWRGRRT